MCEGANRSSSRPSGSVEASVLVEEDEMMTMMMMTDDVVADGVVR